MIKYNDLDEDGTNNEVNTAPGSGLSGNALTGWEFVVYNSAGSEVGRNTTSVENPGAIGDLGVRASIPGLISGIPYTICETQQTGWTNTEPGTIDPTYGEPCETVTLTSSSTVTRYFGNAALGTDLSISKSDGSPFAISGEPLTWLIEVTNHGPLAVVGASVLDELPPSIEPLASWECIASAGASCTASGVGSIQELIDLDVGASVVFALTVDLPDDFSGLIENEASVAPPAGIDDFMPDNNVATDQSVVVLFADGFETTMNDILNALQRLGVR